MRRRGGRGREGGGRWEGGKREGEGGGEKDACVHHHTQTGGGLLLFFGYNHNKTTNAIVHTIRAEAPKWGLPQRRDVVSLSLRCVVFVCWRIIIYAIPSARSPYVTLWHSHTYIYIHIPTCMHAAVAPTPLSGTHIHTYIHTHECSCRARTCEWVGDEVGARAKYGALRSMKGAEAEGALGA